MTTDIPLLSDGFQRLYCDANVFASFSTFHPISFARVLPFQAQDSVVDNNQLIYAEEAHLADRNDNTLLGIVLATERAAGRTRYTVGAPVDAAQATESGTRLKAAMRAFAQLQDIYFDSTRPDTPRPEIQPEGYPFRVERDASALPGHKMNLIFAACGQADALVERGYTAEAKRLFYEAAMLEPEAGFVWDRIKALP